MSTVHQPQTIDIISLIEQRAPTRLVYKASTDGGEYWGNCPWCGGTDRFHAWPHAAKPHYWCRHCERKGDAIQFLIEWEGRSFREACEELGIDGSTNTYKGTDSPLSLPIAPCDKWMEAANDFIYAAHKYLFSLGGKAYREYLLGRGITLEMIDKHNIGCVPLREGRWIETPFERWGLTPEMLTPAQLAKGCIRVPDGLLFPYYVEGKPWKLSMKRPFAGENEMKRGQIIGSKECLLNESLISQDKPVIMTEAYLDALSIEQVAGDLVTAVSTDGTSNSRSLRIQAKLGYAPFVLQAFDNDDAGMQGALWWQQHIKECIYCPIPHGKDPNEMLVNRGGEEVRAWISAEVERIQTFLDNAGRSTPAPTIVIESEPEEPIDTCILCPAVVHSYTPQGNPCCEKHYEGQCIIEQALQEYAESVAIKVPSVDPLTAFTSVINRIQSLFGACEIHYDPPDYTLKDHVAFLNDKHRREEIVKEATMRQKKRDYDYNKLHVSLQ